MTISRSVLCKRLMTLGLDKHLVHRLVDDVAKWEKRSGSDWTITRLKDAKSYYLSKMAGKQPEMVTWWRQVGPKGSRRFRANWLNLPSNSEEDLVKAMIACNAYTLLIQKGYPSQKQLDKFHGSQTHGPSRSNLTTSRQVTGELTAIRDASIQERYVGLSRKAGINIQVKPGVTPRSGKRKLSLPIPFYEYRYSKEKNAPMHFGVKRKEEEMRWVVDNITNPTVMGRLYKYRGLASASGLLSLTKQVKPEFNAHFAGGGEISYLQEPGHKLRAVANPYRVHQVILEPLKRDLRKALEALATDCTFDQRAGAEWAQAKLSEGRTLHAVDLSDATNNIPLDSQLWAACAACQYDLYDKTTSDMISYFVEISRENWKSRPNKGSVLISGWDAGQPMGLGPSFFLFALWHNRLLSMCHAASGSKIPISDSYRIVGDDVVIACDLTHERYRRALAHMDIPVSEAKCISSNRCTEFVGYVITPAALYPIPKWRKLSDRNFMDVLKFLGPQAMSWLQPKQKLVAKALAPIPEELGGLGWNPKGIPMSERVECAQVLGLLEESPETMPVRERSQAVVKLVDRVCYHGNVDYWSGFLSSKLSTLRASTDVTLGRDAAPAIAGQVRLDSDTNPMLTDRGSYQPGPTLSGGDPRGKTLLESRIAQMTRSPHLSVRSDDSEVVRRGKELALKLRELEDKGSPKSDNSDRGSGENQDNQRSADKPSKRSRKPQKRGPSGPEPF